MMISDWDTLPLHRVDGSLLPLAEVVEAAIDHALSVCGDISAAANALGVGRSTVYRRMQQAGWKAPRRAPPAAIVARRRRTAIRVPVDYGGEIPAG